jgi:hypothetical protein
MGLSDRFYREKNLEQVLHKLLKLKLQGEGYEKNSMVLAVCWAI